MTFNSAKIEDIWYYEFLEKIKLLLQKLFHYIVRYHWVEVNSITTARISIEKNSFSYIQDSLLKDTQRHIANFCSNISFALQFLLKNNSIEEELSWTAVSTSNLDLKFAQNLLKPLLAKF